ncbi:MAG: YceI family protein [Ginsengibacter sp.]|jgi:polyisoprenoid-binding protein YceI
MRTKLLFSFLVLFSVHASAQNFVPADDGSNVHFTIKNFGFNTGGDFKGLKGTIFFNPSFPSTATFSVNISSATINTDNETRDKDLREELYFHVEKFPEISLVSTKIDKTNKTDDGFYFFTGNLTIKGVTKPVSFPFKAEKVLNNYLFTGEFSINRLDFGVGEKSTVLSQKVIVNLKVLAKTK